METTELINICNEVAGSGRYIVFTQEQFEDISREQSIYISGLFGHNTLMRLPDSEIRFFEWLRQEDSDVWHDLWGSIDVEPYIVGLSFLPVIQNRNRGFPICDLGSNDNYYFTIEQMVDEESRIFLESVKQRFENRDKLTIAQLLALEIALAPIDIWHFAYSHGLSLKAAKQAVTELVDDRILVHLKDASHIAGFVRF